jgi:hypothetical protein
MKKLSILILVMFFLGCSSAHNEPEVTNPLAERVDGSVGYQNIYWLCGKYCIDRVPGMSISEGIGLYQIRLAGENWEKVLVLRLSRGWYKNMRGYFPQTLDDINEFSNMDEAYSFILEDHKPESIKKNAFDSMKELIEAQK